MSNSPLSEASRFDTTDEIHGDRGNKHIRSDIECDCGRSFRKEEHRQQHLRDLGSRHGEQKTKSRRNRRRATKKRKRVSRKKTHYCTVCGKSFAKDEGLKMHTSCKHPGEE
ncbi:hypothetical protein ACF0H5_023152 [Mactra antiquata]